MRLATVNTKGGVGYRVPMRRCPSPIRGLSASL
jgi:hypothetical protein